MRAAALLLVASVLAGCAVPALSPTRDPAAGRSAADAFAAKVDSLGAWPGPTHPTVDGEPWLVWSIRQDEADGAAYVLRIEADGDGLHCSWSTVHPLVPPAGYALRDVHTVCLLKPDYARIATVAEGDGAEPRLKLAAGVPETPFAITMYAGALYANATQAHAFGLFREDDAYVDPRAGALLRIDGAGSGCDVPQPFDAFDGGDDDVPVTLWLRHDRGTLAATFDPRPSRIVSVDAPVGVTVSLGADGMLSLVDGRRSGDVAVHVVVDPETARAADPTQTGDPECGQSLGRETQYWRLGGSVSSLIGTVTEAPEAVWPFEVQLGTGGG